MLAKRIYISSFFLATNFIVDKVQQCTIKSFIEVCRALYLLQTQKKKNCRNKALSWVIAGKLSQVEQHHKHNFYILVHCVEN